jgi:Fe-S cluster assembly protein SufB
MGQFERTLIIIDEGASAHYVEGCTAPSWTAESLHSAVVEIVVKRNGRFRYTTIQNWANNVYNLVTKRAMAYGDSLMEWVDGNLGSKITMKYPSIYLMEPGARGETLSIAFANSGQHQDGSLCSQHIEPRRLQEYFQGWWSSGLPRTGKGRERGTQLQIQCGLRCVDP